MGSPIEAQGGQDKPICHVCKGTGGVMDHIGEGQWEGMNCPACTPIDLSDSQEVEDWLDEVIGDSIDMDWTSRVGAKAILRAMDREGFAFIPCAAIAKATGGAA